VQQALDAAEAHGRSVAFVGRSMVRNMGVARDLGLLRVPPGLIVDAREIDSLPDRHVCMISTGSQGEPLSALSRMANRDHPVRIEAGDTVILASSLVPGNENAVHGVINGLTRWGAKVIHKGVRNVHVSGHSPAGELLYVLNAVKPRNFMPVHGEWRHLRAHAALGEMTGLAPERIMVVDDGVVVDLVDGLASVTGAVPCGYVYVDGLAVGDVGESSLKDRRILGEEGFITITVVVDSASGKVVAGPEIFARGFSDVDERALDAVRPLIQQVLDQSMAEGVTDPQALRRAMRRAAGRWVSDTYRRRPMLVPVVVEV
jgi:ribonuclease J